MDNQLGQRTLSERLDFMPVEPLRNGHCERSFRPLPVPGVVPAALAETAACPADERIGIFPPGVCLP